MSLYNALLTLSLGVVGLPAVCANIYLLTSTVLSGTPRAPVRSKRWLRFDVVVPAHNEAAVIGRIVASLQRLDWPSEGYRILVVADNCTDTTAQLATEAGAVVLERTNSADRGKGHALNFAFAHCLKEQRSDAIVVVDADSEVSRNLLEAFAARIEVGANAVQAHYGVLNPNVSWRTRLITIAKGAFHIVRSRARERLGLSCGIRGNGWCVTCDLLEKVPFRAFSLTEDVEYGIDLGMAGYRVHYADEARADGEMVSSAASAGMQRRRWEYGRLGLIRQRTLPLLRAARQRRSAICLDLALDLMVLPLSYLALNVGVFFLFGVLGYWFNPTFRVAIWAAGGCVVAMVLYVLRGWQLSGIGWRGLADLVWAPIFLAWKVISILGRGPTEWVRTDREDR